MESGTYTGVMYEMSNHHSDQSGLAYTKDAKPLQSVLLAGNVLITRRTLILTEQPTLEYFLQKNFIVQLFYNFLKV